MANPQNDKPTAEQVQALRAFAARHGRRWKGKLATMWATGHDDYEPEGPTLRSIRNGLGPTWLYGFKLPR